MTKLVIREESLLENVTTSPKCDEDTSTLHESDPENVMALGFSAVFNKGTINHIASYMRCFNFFELAFCLNFKAE